MSESLTVEGELAENVQVEPVQDAGKEPVTEVKAEAPQGEGPKTPPWMQKRLDTLTRQRAEESRRAALAEQRAQEAEALLRKAVEAADPEAAKKMFGEPGQAAPPDVERTIAARAEELAAVQAFNATCNAIYNAGVDEFPDFKDRVHLAQQADVMTPALIEAATEFGDAHRVLYSLTNDMEEATRISKLSPVKMAIALERYMRKVDGAKKEVSSAPPPITPVSGAATPVVEPEKMTHAEWRKWREKQLEDRRRR